MYRRCSLLPLWITTIAVVSAQSAGQVTLTAVPDQVFFPGPATVNLTNTGQQPVAKVILRQSELKDQAEPNGEPLVVPQQQFDAAAAPGEMPVSTGGQAVLHVNLGEHPAAGTYSGNLRFRLESGAEQDIALTVRARGRHAFWIFLAVLLCGYFLSLALQWWLDHGPHQQLEVALDNGRQAMVTERNAIRDWLQQKHASAPHTMARFDGLVTTVQQHVNERANVETETLRAWDKQSKDALAEMNAFHRALYVAAEHYPQQNDLPGAVEVLDEVPANPPDTYEARLVESLDNVGGAAAPQAQPQPVVAVPHLKLARVLVKVMPLVVKLVPLALAFAFAYLTIYDPRKDFGTIRDYINLFAQSLGITQAGGQALKLGHQWAEVTAKGGA